MNKKLAGLLPAALFLAAVLVMPGAPARAQNSSFGAGVHYNVLSGDIDDTSFDSDYFSYVFSLRQRMRSNMSFEVSADYYPGRNEIDYVIRPFAALIWGDMINLGAGVTRSYVSHRTEGGEWSDISYLLQGGVQFPLGNGVSLNLDAFHFMQKYDDIKDIDLKNLTFAVRLFFTF